MNEAPLPPIPPDVPPMEWEDFDAKSEVMKLLNESEPSARITVGPVGTVVVPEDPPVRRNRLWVVERLNLETVSWEVVPVFYPNADSSHPAWNTVHTTRAEARATCRTLNQAFPAVDAYGKHIISWRVKGYVAD